jgi:hypothetical protein
MGARFFVLGVGAAIGVAGLLIPACGADVSAVTGGAGTGGAIGTGGAGGTMGSSGDAGSPATSSTGTGVVIDGGLDAGTGGADAGTGGDDAGTTDAGPTCPSFGDTCTTCASMDCGSAYCACYGNLQCLQLEQCFQGCAPGNTGCFQTCLTAHKDGISSAYLLGDCAATACPTACPTAGMPLSACQRCAFVSCQVQMNDCYADAECLALFACIKPCGGDMTCIQQCEAAHPGGLQDVQAVSFCAKNFCPTVCP